MAINQKQSYSEYNVSTPQGDFAIGFEDYNEGEKDRINVTVDGEDAASKGYTVLRKNPLTIALTPFVPTGTVRLQRETNIDSTFYKFTAGAVFDAANVDANFSQILHSQQEVLDRQTLVEDKVLPLVNGLEDALAKADEASKAAQEAAAAAEEAAQETRSADKVFDRSGKTQQQVNDEVKAFMDSLPEVIAKFKMDGTDEISTLQAYVFAAGTLGFKLTLPKGTITIMDTLLIDKQVFITGSGAGRDSTLIQFKNQVANKPAIFFKRGSAKSIMTNMTVRNFYYGVGRGFQFLDNTTDAGVPCWKNIFMHVEVSGFGIGHLYTATNVLDGRTHAHCSENLWLNCRLVANTLSVKNENCQAVNNMYIRCDIENTDITWLDGTVVQDMANMINDVAGGGFTFMNCSLIGRGKWFTWSNPASSINLFAGSAFWVFDNITAEARAGVVPHNGALIAEDVSGNTGTLGMSIAVRNAEIVTYGATIDLLRFGGRLVAKFQSVSTKQGFGTLNIRNYPTLGRSSLNTVGTLATVIARDCGNLRYERATTSPYGTYDRNSTPYVRIYDSHSASTNSSYARDVDTWAVFNSGGDVTQLAFTYGLTGGSNMLYWNADNPSAGMGAGSELKVVMPKHGRPLKLVAYKHAARLANATDFDLYLCKDKANWATSTFNLTTDAILVSSITGTINKAGYFESAVQLSSAVLGSETVSGFGSWTEGRMLIKYKGTIAFAGFVGVQYI